VIRTLFWAMLKWTWLAGRFYGHLFSTPARLVSHLDAFFVTKSDKALFLEEFKKVWSANQDFLSEKGILRSNIQAKAEKEKVTQLVQKGAKLELGDPFTDADSAFFPPQVYSGLKSEDLRGLDFMAPVFFIMESLSERDLLEEAGKSQFALGASLWTQDRAKAREWAAEIKAGQLWVNDSIFSVALGEIPFGGYKHSGFGKTRGKEGLLEMVQQKFVSFDWRKKRMDKHLPPYEKNSYAILNQLQRMLFLKGFKAKKASGKPRPFEHRPK